MIDCILKMVGVFRGCHPDFFTANDINTVHTQLISNGF